MIEISEDRLAELRQIGIRLHEIEIETGLSKTAIWRRLQDAVNPPRAPRKRLPATSILIERYESGLTLAQVGALYDCSGVAVYKKFLRDGYKASPDGRLKCGARPVMPPTDELIRIFEAERLTMRELAARYGCTANAVWERFAVAGYNAKEARARRRAVSLPRVAA